MKSAYTAIVDQNGYTIGRADEGTRGYTPVPKEGKFPSYKAAQEHAKRMNEAAGIDATEAILIVLGTMRDR